MAGHTVRAQQGVLRPHRQLGIEQSGPPLLLYMSKLRALLLATEIALERKWSKVLLLSECQIPCK